MQVAVSQEPVYTSRRDSLAHLGCQCGWKVVGRRGVLVDLCQLETLARAAFFSESIKLLHFPETLDIFVNWLYAVDQGKAAVSALATGGMRNSAKPAQIFIDGPSRNVVFAIGYGRREYNCWGGAGGGGI